MEAQFSPTSIAVGDTSTLTLTMYNTTGTTVDGVGFTLQLPVNLALASGSWYSLSECDTDPEVTSRSVTTPGGTATAIDVTGAGIYTGEYCDIEITVTSTVADSYPVGDAQVSGTTAGLSVVTASADNVLTVVGPVLTPMFASGNADTGAETLLNLVVSYPDSVVSPPALSGVGYTLTLPAHLSVGTTTAPTTTSPCGGTLTAAPGGHTIQLSGGSSVSTLCFDQVPVVADAAGDFATSDFTLTDPAMLGSTLDTAATVCATIRTYCGTTSLHVTTALIAQTIAFANPGTVLLGEHTLALTGTASSGLTVTYTSETTGVCTVSGSTVQLLTGGACTITASQAGDATYAAAAPVSQTFTVNDALPAAPSVVTAAAGTSSITATWTAPGDTTGITGYTATASPGPATCSTSSAADTTCVLGATAGVAYTISVVAHSVNGDSSSAGPSNEVTVTAPVPPATPPNTNLILTTTKGQITTAVPGQPITFIGTGFAAYSTVVITVYSAPTVLGTAVTDGNGDFSKPITIPPALAAGGHTAVAQGVAPDGTPRAMSLHITVAAPRTMSATGLPVTGLSLTPLLWTAMGGILSGTALLLLSRRLRRHQAARALR